MSISRSCIYSNALLWLERELHDMFSIVSDGIPDFKKLLMYNEFASHYLKKVYPHQKHLPRFPMYKQCSKF